MLKALFYALLVLVIPLNAALAWRQGLNTTFNPAQWPGATIKNLITDYSATCNGIADDTTAYKNFLTDAVLVNGQVVLYIPPNHTCNITFDSTFVTNGKIGSPNSVIANFVMWAYGVTMDLSVGPSAFPDPVGTSPKLIQTVSGGASSVTTVTASDAGAFSVGQWVCVCGLELQQGGTPPNFQFFEYRSVLSANSGTGVVALSAPLTNSYKSTWPTFGGTLDGPAALWPMDVSWNASATIYGLTVPSSGSQANLRSRTVSLVNVTFNKTSAPSANQMFSATNSILTGVEVDKDIETMIFNNVGGLGNLGFQSSAPTNFTMSGGHWAGSFNGIPNNTTVTRTVFDSGIALGSTGFGAATSFAANGLTITAAQQPAMSIAAADVTYSSGTFTTLKTNPNIGITMARAVPGFKYCFNSQAIGPCDSSPKTTFTITDVREDATHYFLDTDIVGSLPNVCGGSACSFYLLYSAKTITQINKPVGTPDITGYAAP